MALKGWGLPFSDPEPQLLVRSGVAEAAALIREEIERTCIRLGRDPRSVRLVGVTKTRTTEEIRTALEAGIEDIGENYIQEAREKARRLPGARWHMIGHLQKNKVNLAVDLFEVIHSLDSISLIRRLDQRCAERHRHLSGLIQVHLGGESTKHGLRPDEVLGLVEELALDPPRYLRLCGLMTVPPPSDVAEDNREHFQTLRLTLQKILDRKYDFWAGSELSMGMSDDYLVAIEEGATMIRLGRCLFGDRPPKVSG